MSDHLQQSPQIAIIDYGMGNLRSVFRAFLEVGGNARIVQHPEEVGEAKALVFPGQGAIVDTMRLLRDQGWDSFIREWIQDDRPFFGICLGLQALFDQSEEGHTAGLGIFRGEVKRFRFPEDPSIKVPHMGWNAVAFTNPQDPMAGGLRPDTDQFYFVHSYYVVPGEPDLEWARTEYGQQEFCSAIRRGNLVATQFHPEKSQRKGLQLYRNFINGLPDGPTPESYIRLAVANNLKIHHQ
jgi:glutamine amidotransferase